MTVAYIPSITERYEKLDYASYRSNMHQSFPVAAGRTFQVVGEQAAVTPGPGERAEQAARVSRPASGSHRSRSR